MYITKCLNKITPTNEVQDLGLCIFNRPKNEIRVISYLDLKHFHHLIPFNFQKLLYFLTDKSEVLTDPNIRHQLIYAISIVL